MSQWVESAPGSSGGPTVSNTEPKNPSSGQEWIDSSYKRPAKKVYINDEIGWKTLVGGSDLPESEKLTPNRLSGGTKTFDVSDLDQEVYFTLASGSGGDRKHASTTTVSRSQLKADMRDALRGTVYKFDGIHGIDGRELVSNSGNGALGKVRIDLSKYDELNVEPLVHGDSGRERTETRSGGDHKVEGKSAKGGDGVRITDAHGNAIAYASGGGGGASHPAWECYVSGAQGGNDDIYFDVSLDGGNGALHGLDGSNRGGQSTYYTGWGDHKARINNAGDGSVKAPGAGSTSVINSSPRTVIGGTYIETFVESKR